MFLDVSGMRVRVGNRAFTYDFSCNRKECIGIFGPSGYGKTTFFRGLTGLEKMESGRIMLDGADISRVPVHKRKIALMFQDYAVFDNLTVERNLKFVLIANRVRRSEWDGMIGRTLEFVGLSDRRKQMAGTLSGGEKQRLALSRCLIIPPKLLLLDEPFNSLDVSIKASVAQRIADVREKYDVTILAISHDDFELESLLGCDRIVRIEDMIRQEAAQRH